MHIHRKSRKPAQLVERKFPQVRAPNPGSGVPI